MKKFNVWILIALVLLALGSGATFAQDDPASPTPEVIEVVVEATETATVEETAVATVVVEQPPVIVETPDVVVIENPSEDRLTLRELGLYAVVAVAVIVLGIIAYRLVTMVGNSYPPGTSVALERARERAQQFTHDSPNLFDDLAFYLADPLVQNAIRAVKEREGSPPDGGAVG